MSWINRDDLIEWLHAEEDEMLDIDGRREAHEASYIRKHVRKMPEMDVTGAVRELKQYCDEHRPICTDCPIRDYELCDGIFPLASRHIEAKMDEEKR